MLIKPDSPFYKNPALWLVVGLPLTTVVVGLLFLIYSIKFDDGAVIDDYYKKGKQINMTIARDEVAADFQLNANLELDKPRKLLNLELEADDDFVYPDELYLRFIHRTISSKDIELKLVKQQSNQYFSVLPELPASHWRVELGTGQWRLKGNMELPSATTIELTFNPTVNDS